MCWQTLSQAASFKKNYLEFLVQIPFFHLVLSKVTPEPFQKKIISPNLRVHNILEHSFLPNNAWEIAKTLS